MMVVMRRALFAVAVALLIPTVAFAATTEIRALLDVDNDAATGCTVGTLAGVDQILVTEVEDDGTTASVTEVHRLLCAAGVLGEPVDVDESGWPAGLDPESGTLLVETRIPFARWGGCRIACDSLSMPREGARGCSRRRRPRGWRSSIRRRRIDGEPWASPTKNG